MKRLYGDRLRQDGGLTKTVKSLAGKTLKHKKSIPEFRRYVDEVRDSLEKVEVKVAETVEELIETARPRLFGFAKDTKNLIQQSRERMTITHIEKDISAYDTSRYSITVASSSSSSPVPRFQVGQPIRVSWTAPANHSRKDWIGIYRTGSCKDTLITKISSMGKWVPIFEEEYRGEEQAATKPEEQVSRGDAGIVTFRGKRLPWTPGSYELRYHHGGKHNVMAAIVPVEIYVDKPADMHSFRSVHDTLLNIVCLALDADVSLVPRSAIQMASSVARNGKARARTGSSPAIPTTGLGLSTGPHASAVGGNDATPNLAGTDASVIASGRAAPPSTVVSSRSPRSIPTPLDPVLAEIAAELQEQSDPQGGTHGTPRLDGHPIARTPDDALTNPASDHDDFVLMDEVQAKHISQMAQWAFGVDISPDVVVADANVTALARRILGARNLEDGTAPLVDDW